MLPPPSLNHISEKRWSILLTTNHLTGWTGSETLLLTLVDGLIDAGCEVKVYVRHLDRRWVDTYIKNKVPITDDLTVYRDINFNVAHVQHNSCLVEVREAFPTLPILFSSLGVLPFLEQPAPFDVGVAHYLAISEEVVSNLVSRGIEQSKITIVRNLVNDRQFYPTSVIRQHPERILVISYKMDESKKKMLHLAAKQIGASISFVGEPLNTMPPDQLANKINEADIVVSLGRGVVEAMLCGRVPIVFDINGGDGIVTPYNVHILQTYNFSGRYKGSEYTVNDLVAELRGYRQEFGERLHKIARENFGLRLNLPRLINIYANIASTSVNLSELSVNVISFYASITHVDILRCKRYQSSTEQLEQEIIRIKQTISWRITAPLRIFWNFYRRLRFKFIK